MDEFNNALTDIRQSIYNLQLQVDWLIYKQDGDMPYQSAGRMNALQEKIEEDNDDDDDE